MKRTDLLFQTSLGRPENSSGSALVLVVLFLVSFEIASTMQGVSPPPDGGYPGGNTAEGQQALLTLSTGAYNTAVGFLSLRSNAVGSANTAIGAGALAATSADQNTATGAGALFSNSTGEANAAHGVFALLNNTDGSDNTANGAFALFNNRTGRDNTAAGVRALFLNDGDPSNNQGSENSAFGTSALLGNTTGYANSAFGAGALDTNTSGSFNTAGGFLALGSPFAQPDGTIETGSSNTAVGAFALGNNTTGNANTALGTNAGSAITTASNVICIGDIAGQNIDNSCFIGNIANTTLTLGSAVFINADGRLGLLTSSGRFKEEIKPMKRSSEALYSLTPVTFRYKKEIDPQGVPQFGLVAEEVEKVNPDLVVHDKEGKPYSVRYEQVNAMLLNEFLKEHRKGEEQDLAISQLKSALAQQQKAFGSKLARQEQQIAELVANLQRLAADLELNKTGSRTVAEK